MKEFERHTSDYGDFFSGENFGRDIWEARSRAPTRKEALDPQQVVEQAERHLGLVSNRSPGKGSNRWILAALALGLIIGLVAERVWRANHLPLSD